MDGIDNRVQTLRGPKENGHRFQRVHRGWAGFAVVAHEAEVLSREGVHG